MANSVSGVGDSQSVGLGRRAVSSAVVLSVRRVIFQLITTGSNIVLARILFPEVFGVFAILSFLVGIFAFFGDIGFGAAIVQQKKEPSKSQLRSIFTLQLMLGAMNVVILWVISSFLVGLYSSQLPEGNVRVLQFLSLSLLFAVPGRLSRVLLERKLEYTRFAIGETLVLVISKVLAIVLAIQGFGVGALVYAELASKLVGSLTFLWLCPWPIGFSLRFKKLSSMVSFGLAFQVSAIVGFLNGAVIPFFIGAFPGPGGWSGAQAVGFITFAAGLAGFARFFSEIIGQLVFPVVSRAQGDARKIRQSVERGLEVAALTSFGLVAVVLALSREITLIVYTDRWLPAVPVLKLLLVQGAEISVGLILMNTLLALGKSRTFMKLSVLWATLQWVTTVFLVSVMGFIGLGWASVLVSAVGVVLPWYILKRNVDFSFLKQLMAVTAIAVVTVVVTVVVKRYIVVESIWELLFAGIMSGGFYSILAYLFMKDRIMLNASYLWKLLRKKGAVSGKLSRRR